MCLMMTCSPLSSLQPNTTGLTTSGVPTQSPLMSQLLVPQALLGLEVGHPHPVSSRTAFHPLLFKAPACILTHRLLQKATTAPVRKGVKSLVENMPSIGRGRSMLQAMDWSFPRRLSF